MLAPSGASIAPLQIPRDAARFYRLISLAKFRIRPQNLEADGMPPQAGDRNQF